MRRRVNIGDRFLDRTASWNTWEVERIYMDHTGLPHAVVSNLSDAGERRTIACPTLLDRSRFRLVTEDGQTQAARTAEASARVHGGHKATGGGFVVAHH